MRVTEIKPSADTPISLRIRDVAKLCGFSERSAWHYVHSGQLASFKVGSLRLVLYSEAKAFMEGIAGGSIVPIPLAAWMAAGNATNTISLPAA